MNLSISSINPCFNGLAKVRKFAHSVSDCIARTKCYAKICSTEKFKPNKYTSQTLLQKNPQAIFEKYTQFNVKNFKELSPLEYNSIKLHTAGKFQNEFKVMSDMVDMSEKWLNEKYGKDNWVFVSIGRSLEELMDSLSYKGHDVRTLPISGVYQSNLSADEIASQKDFKIYAEYLRKLGISKEAIEKDGRHYIFSDYCDTGKTIQTVKKILRNHLGINSENVDFKDFTTMYKEAYNSTSKKRKYTNPEKLEKILRVCTFKEFCRTKRVACNNLGSIQEAFKAKQPLNSKLFHFKLMDAFLPKKLDYTA